MPSEAPPLHPLNEGFEWRPIEGPFRRITPEQAALYNEQGFFVLEDAIRPTTLERVISGIDPFEVETEAFHEAAGGMVVFSSLTPHRTGPNGSSDVRKSYIVQFAPDGAVGLFPDGSGGANRLPANAPDRQFPVLVSGEQP